MLEAIAFANAPIRSLRSLSLKQSLPLAAKQKAFVADQDIGRCAVYRAAVDVGSIHRHF